MPPEQPPSLYTILSPAPGFGFIAISPAAFFRANAAGSLENADHIEGTYRRSRLANRPPMGNEAPLDRSVIAPSEASSFERRGVAAPVTLKATLREEAA